MTATAPTPAHPLTGRPLSEDERKFFSPQGRGWDHRVKCMTRADAEFKLAEIKLRPDPHPRYDAQPVKLRVRQCPVCHRWCIQRVAKRTGQGDLTAQRRRRRQRQRAAEQGR